MQGRASSKSNKCMQVQTGKCRDASLFRAFGKFAGGEVRWLEEEGAKEERMAKRYGKGRICKERVKKKADMIIRCL